MSGGTECDPNALGREFARGPFQKGTRTTEKGKRGKKNKERKVAFLFECVGCTGHQKAFSLHYDLT